jgi:hypothetical protein
VFREVNEQIRRLQEESPLPGYVAFICECSRLGCQEAIDATIDEYRGVRADPRHFLIAHGHIDADLERVIRVTKRFMVVEKFGVAGEIAEAEA